MSVFFLLFIKCSSRKGKTQRIKTLCDLARDKSSCPCSPEARILIKKLSYCFQKSSITMIQGILSQRW
jgi:hypothetical protein